MPLPSLQDSQPPDLTGLIVLVTGATGGLGRAIARACATCGATVVLHGRIPRKLDALYDAIVATGAPEPVILPLDFAKAQRADFDSAAGALQRQLGYLDALVHTAAFLGSLGPIEHQDFDRWLEVLRINVAAPMALTRAMLPALATSADASVTFTLDMRGVAPRAYWGAYAASKAAVHALAATLTDEWDQRAKLRINALVPGPMRSPLRTLTHPGEDKSALPSPEDLLPLYLHLIRGQQKHDSGVMIDGQAWLQGRPAMTPLIGDQTTMSPLSQPDADASTPSDDTGFDRP